MSRLDPEVQKEYSCPNHHWTLLWLLRRLLILLFAGFAPKKPLRVIDSWGGKLQESRSVFGTLSFYLRRIKILSPSTPRVVQKVVSTQEGKVRGNHVASSAQWLVQLCHEVLEGVTCIQFMSVCFAGNP